ncbi:hypothetical protein BCR39DRAFT_465430 [Naematelia encephala]|uniref:Zn(2)-C6 fungal-type domain-containing protein n=1 Tax=Naematelia encephala TaxID=71784 RepID=A0A1Y2BAR8_9TREE|nr:hypothetical protein BCR39DRAFT_465430 [Naematelia encephala]
MGLTPGQVKAEITGNKRVKVEEKPKKEGAKEGKKSCSECRRLKAKCDRVFPCSNCRRRGCALVCPDGDLSCMQGKRLVLASTEQLHERIAQLESALVKAHSSSHSGPHPLLAAEYLDGGFASMPTPPGQSQLQPSHSPPSLADGHFHSPKDRYSDSSFTLATPHLSADRSSSQGRMAVESLLLTDDQAAPEGKREDDWVGENAAPALIVGTVDRAPSEERSDERRAIFERLRSILRVVPPRDVTRRKAEQYWQTSTWYGNILRKEEFDSIYEPAVYAPTPANPITPHKLACVLMLLALHTYFDLEADEEDPAIAEYWEGAQMCFDTRFGWASSVAGVQALGLATLFVGFGWRGAKATNFYWLRQMTTAVQALGLHKDPHPSLPEEEREFRRRVFHESYCIDCLISINHGQRTGVQLENIEAAMPKEQKPLLRIKYEYMQNVKAVVIDIGCRPDSSPASWELVNQTDARLMKSE